MRVNNVATFNSVQAQGGALSAVRELLHADHRRIEGLLGAIASESTLASRACYASQLVRTCSEIEDVRDRTLYRVVDLSSSTVREARRTRCSEIKSLLAIIDAHTHRVLPANVHMHDGVAFEDTLSELVHAMKIHLEHEKEEILPRIEALSESELTKLAKDMGKARRNALHRPHRKVGTMSRYVLRIVDRLHDIEDAPDYFHRDLRHSLSERSIAS